MCPPRPSSERASYGQFHAPCKAHQQQVLPSTSPCALLRLRDFDQFLEKVDERHGRFWIKRSRTTCASISEHVLCKLRHGVYREACQRPCPKGSCCIPQLWTVQAIREPARITSGLKG